MVLGLELIGPSYTRPRPNTKRLRAGRAPRTLTGVSFLAPALLVAAALVPLAQDRAPGTNRLGGESSPYLLLHATNPVDWYPWGEEAIELARKLDKPIFLSIGYSTCYWCHRMEEDVFTNPDIAALMNDGFINIKVDREERPDLDEIYMTATQVMTQRGGWPNSLFLTPSLEPFFAGTYFPPEDRGGAPGFPTVLRRIRDLWSDDRARIQESAEDVASRVEDIVTARSEARGTFPDPSASVERALAGLRDSYDDVWGGFGSAPKFPSPANLYLLRATAARGDESAKTMLVATLRRMGEGAIYDHLGGGFHRYATDREWRVPHFEKMLYDNAALAAILVDTARLTGDPELARLARGTLDFLLEKMTGKEGGFHSAIDAQTEGREGAFYVWTREEVARVLTEEELALVGPIFGLDEPPNFEGTDHTLYWTAPLEEHAARLGLTREALLARLAPALEKLKTARSERPFPLVDDKVLTDWNGMAIEAMASGGAFFDEPRYREAAKRAADFLLSSLRRGEGKLRHVYRNGEAKIDAFLDDYAFLMEGLLTLHRESGERAYLDAAASLADELEARLRDPNGGYYQTTPKAFLPFQTKSAFDGATRSGNGVAVLGLLELAERTGQARYRDRAEDALRAFASDVERYPGATRTLALALDDLSPVSQAAGAPAPLPIEELARSVVSATLEPAGRAGVGGFRPFRVTLRLAEGWHVNANPASSRFLVPTEVRGEVREVVYPPGTSMKLAFSDEAIAVYSGEVRIAGELASDATTVTLIYQACDDTRCLSPVETTVGRP